MKPKLQRQEEAKVRQDVRGKRSVTQQIEALDKKLGKGVGAKKERSKLNGK